MSKSSCEAAKSLEEAFLRMARGERPQARMARGERPLYALFHTFRYSTYATIAVTLSVQTNAHHTPVTPMRRLKTNAAGMITATYRITEITREAIPCPSASRAPELVTDTADRIKPRLMICSAMIPMVMVSGFSVNSPISPPGISQHSAVPAAMIPAVSSNVRR